MPRHVERSAAENSASIGKMVKQDLAEDHRPIVSTMHGLSDDFLDADVGGPR
jgi:hypothetical protein